MTQISWSPDHPDAEPPEELVNALLAGRVAILPTDTIYGIHASASRADAIERIYQLKGRDRGKPLPVLFSSVEQISASVRVTAETLRRLAEIWPAPLTAILPLAGVMPAAAGFGTVAGRIPDLPWLRKLLSRTGPLASTSVNLAGETPAASIDEIPDNLMAQVGCVVDVGPLEGQPSTLVDFTEISPRVVRMGAFSFTQNLWKTL